MDIDNVSINEIRISLELQKDCFSCLSQKVVFQLKEPPLSAMKRKWNILTDDHGPTNSNSSPRGSKPPIHSSYFGSLSFWNRSVSVVQTFLIGVEGVPPIPPFVSRSLILFKDPNAAPHSSFVLPTAVLGFRRRSLPRFQELWNIGLTVLHKYRQIISP